MYIDSKTTKVLICGLKCATPFEHPPMPFSYIKYTKCHFVTGVSEYLDLNSVVKLAIKHCVYLHRMS